VPVAAFLLFHRVTSRYGWNTAIIYVPGFSLLPSIYSDPSLPSARLARWHRQDHVREMTVCRTAKPAGFLRRSGDVIRLRLLLRCSTRMPIFRRAGVIRRSSAERLFAALGKTPLDATMAHTTSIKKMCSSLTEPSHEPFHAPGFCR
jgi:hypothetical protein